MALFRIAAGASCTRISCRSAQTAILASVISVTALFEGSAFAQNLQSSDDQNSIRGTVVNAVTHAPIARALVHSADDHCAIMTDSDGHFEFTAPAGTQIWLLARKPGYLGDRNTGNALETSAGNEITLPLMPESIIKGRVSTSTGETIAGIDVELLTRQIRGGVAHWRTAAMAQTKSDGSFRFAELGTGAYKIMTREFMEPESVVNLPGAQSYGFPPVYFPAAADFSGAATINLASGQTFEANLTITDQPYYPVKIPVGNGEMNGGMGGMEVRVTLQGQGGPGYSLGYNASTHKIEGLLPNGNYTVEAFTYGQDSANGEVSLRVAGAPVEISPLTLIRNSSVTLEVQKAFTQSGTGFTANGGNSRHSYVGRGPQLYLYPRLEPADDFVPWSGGSVPGPGSPNDGSIVIQNVPPGRYWLRLNPGYGYVASATMGGIDLLHQPFDVGSGSNIPIEITMRDDTATLQGSITNAASQASTSVSAWVYCVPLADGPGRFEQGSVSSDGKFNFSGMAPGSYRVMAFASPQPGIPYRDAEAMRAYDTKGQVIHLAAGQNASVQLQIIADE
jgi:hypothetical protein